MVRSDAVTTKIKKTKIES